jgi:hypothetical protein
MKKYLNKGTLSELIVTVISTSGEYTLVSYPSGEMGQVLTSQLSDYEN